MSLVPWKRLENDWALPDGAFVVSSCTDVFSIDVFVVPSDVSTIEICRFCVYQCEK